MEFNNLSEAPMHVLASSKAMTITTSLSTAGSVVRFWLIQRAFELTGVPTKLQSLNAAT